jgi:hypothetical protein
MMTEGIGWEESFLPHIVVTSAGLMLGEQWIDVYNVTSKSRSSVLR